MKSYKAGGQGGRVVIDFPAENKGNRYTKSFSQLI